MFVRAREDEGASLGIGKEISISGQHCSVEYFDAPVSKPIVLDLDIAAIEAVTLPEQTRIYHFNDAIGAWETGRLLDDHGDKQFIRFPNGVSRYLNVADVFVRCSRGIEDPTAFLGAKISETPRFADDRSCYAMLGAGGVSFRMRFGSSHFRFPKHPTGLGKRKREVHQSSCSAVHQKTRRRSTWGKQQLEMIGQKFLDRLN